MDNINGIIKSCKEFKKESIKILGIEQSISNIGEYHGLYDIVIITASSDEFESVKEIINSPSLVVFNKYDSTIYYRGTIQGKNSLLKVLLPFPYSMGIEAASALTTKVVSSFRPKYILMVGICAGNKNICKIGDIIIAEKSLNYHGVVEIENKDESQNKKFMQNLCSINGHLKNQLEIFSKSSVISQIKQNYPFSEKIETPLRAHIGLLVTGSSLLRSGIIIQEINNTYVGVKGLDMETYGVYYAATQVYLDYAPNFVSIKGVSDYGDNTNHKLSQTERRKYALYTSINALKYFLNENIE